MMRYYLTITLTNYNDFTDDDLEALTTFYNELLERNNINLIIDQSYATYIDYTSTETNYKTINRAYDIITAYDGNGSTVKIMEVK